LSLQGSDFAGVLFSATSAEGTFPLSQVRLDAKQGAPDVMVSSRWSGDRNDWGAPGMVTAIEGKRGRGTHASLSRFDLHNTLIASGPDFKRGFVSEIPSGNVDLAPTVLAILGVPQTSPMDGRVLNEAMVGSEVPVLKPQRETLEASRDLGFRLWHQYLTFTRVGSVTCLTKGTAKPAEMNSPMRPRGAQKRCKQPGRGAAGCALEKTRSGLPPLRYCYSFTVGSCYPAWI
jgi:hypothetical protein